MFDNIYTYCYSAKADAHEENYMEVQREPEPQPADPDNESLESAPSEDMDISQYQIKGFMREQGYEHDNRFIVNNRPMWDPEE